MQNVCQRSLIDESEEVKLNSREHHSGRPDSGDSSISFNFVLWAAGSFEWRWKLEELLDVELLDDFTIVHFHPEFSVGTEVVKGTENGLSRSKQHFWEVQLLDPVYGTDMMIGMCTELFDVNSYRYGFRSALGEDNQSWGISYHGLASHGGMRARLVRNLYHNRLTHGTIVGIHLDTWHACATVYINRKSYGVVWRDDSFSTRAIYPAVSSTAARTKMKLLGSRSADMSLCYLASRVVSSTYEFSEIVDIHTTNNMSFNVYLDYYWLF